MPQRAEFSESDLVKELEFWESLGLLFPYKRIILPKKLVSDDRIGIEDHNRGRSRLYPPKSWPDSWVKLHEMVFKKTELIDPTTRAHYIDKIKPSDRHFIEPQKQQFKSWSKYEFKLDLGDHYATLSTAQPKYHYYQIHLLDAVRRENTACIRGSWSTLPTEDQLKARVLPDKMLPRKGQRKYLVRSNEIRSFGLQYDFLSQFIFTAPHLAKDQEYKLFAKRIAQASAWPPDEWFKFMNHLSKLRLEYDLHERPRMAAEIAKDIAWLVELICDGFEISTAQVFANSERPAYGGGHPRTLLQLSFPDPLEEAEIDAFRLLQSRLSLYNAETLLSMQIDDNSLKEFCAFMRKRGLGVFLLEISALINTLNNKSATPSEDLFSHIRTVSVSLEDLILEICLQATDSAIRADAEKQYKTGNYTLALKIKTLFVRWKRRNDISEAIKRGKNIPPNKVATQIRKVLRLSLTRSKEINCKFVLRKIVMSYIARNLSNHKLMPPAKVLQDHRWTLLNSLLESMLFVWAYAKSTNLISSQRP